MYPGVRRRTHVGARRGWVHARPGIPHPPTSLHKSLGMVRTLVAVLGHHVRRVPGAAGAEGRRCAAAVVESMHLEMKIVCNVILLTENAQ